MLTSFHSFRKNIHVIQCLVIRVQILYIFTHSYELAINTLRRNLFYLFPHFTVNGTVKKIMNLKREFAEECGYQTQSYFPAREFIYIYFATKRFEMRNRFGI